MATYDEDVLDYVQVTSIRNLLMRDCHDNSCVAHLGTKKTLELVKHYY